MGERSITMKRISTAEARWIEDRKHWKINVQKDGCRRSFYDSTPGKRGKALCEAKAADWLDSMSLTDPRFDTAWESFIAKKDGQISDCYLTDMKGFGANWFIPAFGKKKLSYITEQMVQDVLDSMYKAGRSAKTIANARGAWVQFAKFCRKNRYELERFGDLEINKHAVKGEKLVLSPSQIATVFDTDQTLFHRVWTRDHYIHAYRFAIITGERRGEITGLKWEDITEKGVTIQRSINRLGQVTDGKNDNARRTVPMTKMLKKVLDDQKEYLKSTGIISPYVFPDEKCSEINDPRPLFDSWKRFCKSHDLPAVTFHGLRHTMISLYKADLPEELLKQVVGHSASMDTFGVYGHAMDGDEERTVRIMDDVISGILSRVV